MAAAPGAACVDDAARAGAAVGVGAESKEGPSSPNRSTIGAGAGGVGLGWAVVRDRRGCVRGSEAGAAGGAEVVGVGACCGAA